MAATAQCFDPAAGQPYACCVARQTRANQALKARQRHADAFKALSHLTRLQIFFLLARRGGELPAGEIATLLKVPGPTLSHHLNLLHQVQLVQRRRDQRNVYYSVQPGMVSEMVRLLTACC